MTVAGLGDDHVWHGIEKSDIVNSVMRAAVGSGDIGAIQRKYNGKVLHADILEHIVKSSL